MTIELLRVFLGVTAYYFGFRIIIERVMQLILAKEVVSGRNFSNARTEDESPIRYRAYFSLPVGLALAIVLGANFGGTEAVRHYGPFAGCIAFLMVETS